MNYGHTTNNQQLFVPLNKGMLYGANSKKIIAIKLLRFYQRMTMTMPEHTNRNHLTSARD